MAFCAMAGLWRARLPRAGAPGVARGPRFQTKLTLVKRLKRASPTRDGGSVSQPAGGLSRPSFERMLDLLPTPVVIVEPGTAAVRYANAAADRLAGGRFPLGAPEERYDVLRSTDAEGRRLAMDETPAARAGRGERLEGLQVDWHIAGGTTSLIVFADTVPADGDGPAMALVAFEDVTALREEQRETRESLALLDKLFAAERDARERAERAERRASFMARAGRLLGASLDYEETLRQVADAAVPDKADCCVVDLVEPSGAIRRHAVRHADPAMERRLWEMPRRWPPRPDDSAGTPAVVRTGESQVVPRVSDELLRSIAHDDEHLAALRALGLTAAMVLPLTVRGQVEGTIAFGLSDSGRELTADDVEVATEIARRASIAMDQARLYQERSHIAQTLQQSLLPARLPEIPGFEVAARYRAAGEGYEVGGDFYDVLRAADDRCFVALGDVCGKGAEAAALTAMARYTLRTAATLDVGPGRALAILNDAILRERTDGRFMTAVVGLLDLSGPRPAFTLACAGHPAPLVRRAGGSVDVIPASGMLLGIDAAFSVAEHHTTLDPGDALVLHTDGVAEAGAPDRVLGFESLAAVLRAQGPGAPAGQIAEAVEAAAIDAADGEPRDDMAIVVLAHLGQDAE
jgi:serine phosphatase RsbU (regulator of sigma subunit)